MPENETTPDATTETPAEATVTPETETEETPKADSLDDLPDWAQKEIKSLRGESANYRTKFRDAETKLAEAKTPEEFAEVQSTIAGLHAELARERVANDLEVPKNLRQFLTASTEDELKEQATALMSHYSAPAPDPADLKGGLTPSDDNDEFDPEAAASAYLKRRYGR